MKIHKSDAKVVAHMGCKSWGEIMALVEERAQHRQGVLEERVGWGNLTQGFMEQ